MLWEAGRLDMPPHHALQPSHTTALVSNSFTLPDILRRNTSQKMSRRSRKGVKRPRQQQVQEDDAQTAPLHLTAHPTLPLPLLSVAQSYRGMCVSAQLRDVQGAPLFPFVCLPQRELPPLAGALVYDMSLTHGERLRVVACVLTGKLVRLLSLGVGRSSTTTTSTVSTTTAPTPIRGTSTTTTIATIITTHYPPHLEPNRNWRACHKLMHFMVARVAAKLIHSLAAAEGNKVIDQWIQSIPKTPGYNDAVSAEKDALLGALELGYLSKAHFAARILAFADSF